MVLLAAHAFALLALGVLVFQVALALGAPWGHLTWGGRFPGRLPGRMRLGAVASALLMAAFAVVVEAQAGAAGSGGNDPGGGLAEVLVRVVVVYCAVGTVANAVTPSRQERCLWLPVVAAMLLCSLVVALS